MSKKISQITNEESTSVSDTDWFEGEETGGTSFKVLFSVIKSTLKSYFDSVTTTLTNKTLTAPTIADFTNAAHDHGDADDGGVLVAAAVGLTTQGDILYRDASGLARLPAGAAGYVLTTGGSGANPSWAIGDLIGQRRLSLTSATPVTNADVTAATSVYWTDGTTNLSVAVPSTTVTPFDVFYDTSAGTLSTVNWTNDTTRATALVYSGGRLAKTGDTAKIYLGTGRTTSVSGQCEDSVTKRFLWNMYNRAERSLNKYDSTNSWNYSTATWRSANNSTANRVEFVQGLDENRIVAEVAGAASDTGAGNFGLFGMALDATNTNHCASDGLTFLSTVGTANQVMPTYGRYTKHVGIGYHYLQWTEYSNGAGTTTFYGQNTTLRQSGIVGRVIG